MGKKKKGGGGGGEAEAEGGGAAQPQPQPQPQPQTEKKDDNNGGNILNIVLKVDLHCDGCTKRIRKHTINFHGVLEVEFEGESKVKVMTKNNVNPTKLREFVEKKTGKKTELVSPQPSKKDAKKEDNNNNNNNNNNPKEVPVTTVTLKVPYHCDGCGDRLYKAITSYKGVHEVKIEKEKDRVKVTGRMEAKKMVEDLTKKLKKKVEIAPPDKKDKEKDKEKENDKKEKKEGGADGGGDKDKKEGKMEYVVNGSGYVGLCDGTGRVLQIFDTPQFFSDDNPNACSIM